MEELLSRADFKYIDPNWDPFEYLLQIAKFEEEKMQTNHDHGQSVCKQENMGLKQSFRFNNKYNGGKKTKRSFKEEDGDGEWKSGGLKPKSKRSKKQRFTLNNNAGKKIKPGFKEEDENGKVVD
ncbi:hypothetical protein HRI_002440300 [Hibiscus trionum]|uniref:Uncharacterized protein n=1 Tax=Hibiscus trionum TaxID=183268 RepID=A0A9W7M6S8_HIBTR|nr:hypothetical protein HRI_002440300 [Hibiscus trionum]